MVVMMAAKRGPQSVAKRVEYLAAHSVERRAVWWVGWMVADSVGMKADCWAASTVVSMVEMTVVLWADQKAAR